MAQDKANDMTSKIPRSIAHSFALVATLAIVGCNDRHTLDGSSPEAFTRSVSSLARALPENERPAFLEALSAVSLAEGSLTLEQPSLATLVALDGKTPAMVEDRARVLLEVQQRQHRENQLDTAERDLQTRVNQLDAAKAELQAVIQAKTYLQNILVTEVIGVLGEGKSGNVVLQFKVDNRNKVPAEIRGLELVVQYPSGISKTYGKLSMLGMGSNCIYGQTIKAEEKIPVSCSIRLRYEADAEYMVRVAEIYIPGTNFLMLGTSSEERARAKVAELSAAIDQKQREVDALKGRLKGASGT